MGIEPKFEWSYHHECQVGSSGGWPMDDEDRGVEGSDRARMAGDSD